MMISEKCRAKCHVRWIWGNGEINVNKGHQVGLHKGGGI